MGRNRQGQEGVGSRWGHRRAAGLGFVFLLGLLLAACATSPVNHYNRGVDFQDKGDSLAAIREYRRAIELNPQDPAPRFNLGVLYQDMGKLSEAEDQYRAILGQHPNYGPAWINLSAIQEEEGNLEAAERSLDRALQTDRDNPYPVSQRGFLFLKKGRVPEAREAFLESLRRDPAWANGHFGLGKTAEASGDPVQALRHYQDCTKHNPNDLEGHLKVAELALSQGDRELAVRHLRKAADLDRTRGETFFILGLLLQEAGKWRAALDAFERALHLRVNPARCHLALSQLHQRLALEELRAYERELQQTLPAQGTKP